MTIKGRDWGEQRVRNGEKDNAQKQAGKTVTYDSDPSSIFSMEALELVSSASFLLVSVNSLKKHNFF
jgi:hypothetical protein